MSCNHELLRDTGSKTSSQTAPSKALFGCVLHCLPQALTLGCQLGLVVHPRSVAPAHAAQDGLAAKKRLQLAVVVMHNHGDEPQCLLTPEAMLAPAAQHCSLQDFDGQRSLACSGRPSGFAR